MASRRRRADGRNPSKRESRAAREKRLEFEKRSAAAKLAWKQRKEREAAEFKRRSEASKLGHVRRAARKAVPKIAAQDKSIKAKVRAVKAKVSSSKRGKTANTDVYSKAQRKADRAEIKRLREENERLKEQVQAVIDTSGWVSVLPDEWVREDGSIALHRCRLRHTEDAKQIKTMLDESHAIDGDRGVKRVVRNLTEHYENFGDWPDDDPMTEHEIWTLFFSP